MNIEHRMLYTTFPIKMQDRSRIRPGKQRSQTDITTYWYT